jgi:hypothetical protein
MFYHLTKQDIMVANKIEGDFLMVFPLGVNPEKLAK